MITPLPDPPLRSDGSATFADKGDAFMSALPTFALEANALEANVDALEASAQASAAEAAASQQAAVAASGSTIWVSGTTYAVGDVRWSPLNSQSYRRRTAGAGATDPSADATNWAQIAGVPVQTGHAGKVLKTDGTDATWGYVVSPGAVIYHAANTPPVGFLKANGAAVSRSTYAALFAAIGTTFGAGDGSTTFALPDLRGYFARAWDDARGIDTGRAFGSFQADANLSHTHTAGSGSAGSHSHTNGIVYASGSGPSSGTASADPTAVTTTNLSYPDTGTAGSHTHTVTVTATGGTEARPKNIALLACIKY